MSQQHLHQLLLRITLLVLAGNSYAEFRLPHIISDNMMLQQNEAARIWGLGDDGTTVTVTFKKQSKSATVKNGEWLLALDPEPHGGPFELSIKHGEETTVIKNVLIGEVWQAAGQSNMQMSVMGETNWPEAQNYPPNDQIRLFHQKRNAQGKPSFNTLPTKWAADTNASRRHFSAVAYYFARVLHEKLKVPVGISLACEGGTKCQYWTPLEAFQTKPDYKDYLDLALDSRDRFQAIKTAFEGESAEWLKRRKGGEKVGKPPVHYGRHPAYYYNGNIHPIRHYTIRGAIWYQGERNSINTRDAYQYRNYLPLMIQSWRQAFRNPQMPFYLVQIPKMGLRDRRDNPVTRESQLLVAQSQDNVDMVVGVDKGEASLHPKTKRFLGERLANLALGDTYKKAIDYRFPLYDRSEIRNGTMIIHFAHAEKGLKSRDGQALREFTICGADRKFVAATAEIQGASIVVSSPDVDKPVAVRYGWSNAPDVNLVGANDLPASPFRTDQFELEEVRPTQKNWTAFQ